MHDSAGRDVQDDEDLDALEDAGVIVKELGDQLLQFGRNPGTTAWA